MQDKLRTEFGLPKPAVGGSPLKLVGDGKAGTLTICAPQPVIAAVEARAKILLGLAPAVYAVPPGAPLCGCSACPWRWGSGAASTGAGAGAGAGAGSGGGGPCRNHVQGSALRGTRFDQRMHLLRQASSVAEITRELGTCCPRVLLLLLCLGVVLHQVTLSLLLLPVKEG